MVFDLDDEELDELEEFDYSDVERKISAILNWANHEMPTFDDSYIVGLQEKLDDFGKLFPNQVQAIDKIIDKWGIDVDKYSDM